MNKKAIAEVNGFANDLFEGDLELAAAAHVFGPGVVKMKHGVPGHANDEQLAEISEIVATVTKANKSAAPPKTARGSKGEGKPAAKKSAPAKKAVKPVTRKKAKTKAAK